MYVYIYIYIYINSRSLSRDKHPATKRLRPPEQHGFSYGVSFRHVWLKIIFKVRLAPGKSIRRNRKRGDSKFTA